MSTASTAWPHERSTRSAVLAQFGEARADLAGWALTTGDPLADAVVEEIHAGGRAGPQRADHRHPRTGSPPSPIRRPRSPRSSPRPRPPPPTSTMRYLDAGCRPYFSSHPASRMIALSAGALVRTYSSPSIAAVLGTTGRLVDAADRRLLETGMWVNSRDAARRAAPRSGRVRRDPAGPDDARPHPPARPRPRRSTRLRTALAINQIDLARTWMDFTLTSYRAEQAMGFDRTPSEVAAAYRYWWHVAHLLGLDPRLIEGVSSHEQAARVDALLQAVTGPASPDSAALADASLASIARSLHEVVGVPVRIGRPALDALTRRFHGHALGDDLGLPRAAAADALLGPAIAAVRWDHRRRRADPDAWRRVHETGMAAARGLLEQPGEPPAFRTA